MKSNNMLHNPIFAAENNYKSFCNDTSSYITSLVTGFLSLYNHLATNTT